MPERNPLAQAARQAARDMRRLPPALRKDLSREVREQVARPLAEAVAAAASGAGTYGALLRGSVKARAGLEPTIVVGGQSVLASGGARAGHLFYGTEFGADASTMSTVNRARAANGKGRARGRVTGAEVAAQAAAGKSIFNRHSTRQFVGRHRPFVFPTYAREANTVFTAWADVVTRVIDEHHQGG